MTNIKIYFDGYCPESLLKDQQIEMKLNQNDFWESEATGLQISANPPFAVILPWRGSGKFRTTSEKASDSLKGLILTEHLEENGKENFPDDSKIISDHFQLEYVLNYIYENKAAYDKAKFNPADEIFEEQKSYLDSLKAHEFGHLLRDINSILNDLDNPKITEAPPFQHLHKELYNLKLVFPFDWMAWNYGVGVLKDLSYDYRQCSMLELSMFITTIFRSDRFNEGTIEAKFADGTLIKLFEALKSKINAI